MATSLLMRRATGPLMRRALHFLEQPSMAAVASAGQEVPHCARAGMIGAPVRWVNIAREPASQPPLDDSLMHVLKSEIEHETDVYKPSKTLAKGPPQPFTLEDKPGKLEVSLHRKYGEEDVKLTAMYQPGMEEGEELEGEGEYDNGDDVPEGNAVHLTVSITKGAHQPVLEFSCVCQKGDVTIGHVHYVENKESKDPIFDGPEFSQLDEHLQKQFKKFLDVRGIDADLANFLLELMEDKEQREYSRWLKNIEAFVKK